MHGRRGHMKIQQPLEEAFSEFSEESLMLAEDMFQACAEVVIGVAP